jgi:hypothetical protein
MNQMFNGRKSSYKSSLMHLEVNAGLHIVRKAKHKNYAQSVLAKPISHLSVNKGHAAGGRHKYDSSQATFFLRRILHDLNSPCGGELKGVRGFQRYIVLSTSTT